MSSDEEESLSEFIKNNYSLEDFLNCDQTRLVLEDEHFNKFDNKPREAIKALYEKIWSQIQCENTKLLIKDIFCSEGETLAALVFNNINPNYDISIFCDCPPLAKALWNK